MKRRLSLLMVLLLIFGTGIELSTYGSEVSDEKTNNIQITLGENANKNNATFKLVANNDGLNEIELILPKVSSFNQTETTNVNGSGVNFNYSKSNHSLIISWNYDLQMLESDIVLNDLTNENILILSRAVYNDGSTKYKEHYFEIESSDKEEKFEMNDNKGNKNDEDIDEESFSQQKEQPTENEKKLIEKNSSGGTIAPFAGNLNVDIDISPQKANVLSGNDAVYNLVLKVTGARIEYTSAKVIVDLPITNYTQFTQDISELIIDGVTPIYDDNNHQLIYEFDSIKSGRSYETLIKVNTENGNSPNGAELKAEVSFEANEQAKITDDATVKINASSSISVSKKFKEARLSGNVQRAPFPGSYTIWDIKVSIPKKDIGQMFLKEGSKIVIRDTFDSGLSYYDVMNNTPTPEISGRTLTWEFDAPTLQQQMQADGEFYTVDLRVRLQVINNNNLIGTTQENNISVEAIFIDDKAISATAKDTIPIISREEATGDITGNWYAPTHNGPSNGKGGIAPNDNKNPNPPVYSDALLGFSHGIAPLPHSQHGDFKSYTTIYQIDRNLKFEKLSTPGRFEYRPNSTYPAGIQLSEQPRFNIQATVNGTLKTLVTNAETGRIYTRADLGLSQTDNVIDIRYDFTYAPSGMLNIGRPNYYFTVKEGYTGEVVNTFNVYGRDANDNQFNQRYHEGGRDTEAGPRSATIVPRPTDQPPIGTVAIELLNHDNSEVIHGENRMKVRLANLTSSTLVMQGPLETVVLLPPGVTLSSNPNATYKDTDGLASTGRYEILNENYNGSGRQLVKIKWSETRIDIGKNLEAELDVFISDGAPNTLQFDVYGFSGEEELRVPSSSGNAITNTVLQIDDEDLNNNGNSDEPRLKSGNIYTIRGQYDIQTEKLVKGALDEDYTYFGHTTPGGTINYQMKLTNTTGRDITKMTLIDVLPSVGDLGITDNAERGSQFTPNIVGPIVLPEQWQDKVDIFYSTAKNPRRDDLTKNTDYPATTTPLTNPQGAEEPNWVTEVSDWSTIHSFKIVLKEGTEWIKGEDITIEFTMKAPEAGEVERDIIDASIDPTKRAAWNSFAVATDQGQPVEPLRVGVYMDYNIEEPDVKKTVNDEGESAELTYLDEQIIWKVDFNFGNYTTDWESVVLRDELNELIDINFVKVENQDGEDVIANGNLDITDNIVTFTLNKQNDSFAYLRDQTYTLIIDSNIKSDVTAEDLEPYINLNGIPNEAEIIINDHPKLSNKVRVRPPVLGDIHIVKVDKGTGETLQGSDFELFKCFDGDSVLDDCNLIKSGTSDEKGQLSFLELQIGHYKLVETRAPEGYRVLKQPISIEIDVEERQLEIEVENSKNGWNLPATGGIGSSIFYGLGALLMLVALYILFKHKNNKIN